MSLMKTLFNRRSIAGYFAALGGLIICFFIVDKMVMPLYTKQHAEVELPDVVEKSAVEAEYLLKSQGFRMIIDKSEYHPVLPESTVVFQKPAPFTKVKRGRRIYVHISAGEKTVMVPRIIGLSERDAQFQLQKAQLDVGDIQYHVSTYPKDVVCDQELPPNTEVPEKTKISFSVSLGRSKTQYVVPDVTGRTLQEAVSLIRKEGLRMGRQQMIVKEDLLPQTVISQQPKPGMTVKSGQSVDLVVSRLPHATSTGDSIAPN
ncbi:PASTA domain-containing protein [bacterium]|nr:PASTA domain-containing protein [bacterium]